MSWLKREAEAQHAHPKRGLSLQGTSGVSLKLHREILDLSASALSDTEEAQDNKHRRAKETKKTRGWKPLAPQYVTIHESQVTPYSNQKGVEDVVAALGVENEHQDAKTSRARITNVPHGPSLRHISHSFWQAIV